MGVPGPWGRDPRRPDNQLKTHTHTEKEKAKLGFTGFYWVLLGFTGFYLVSAGTVAF